MHSRSPFACRALATLGTVATLGCGLADIFSSPGPEPVVLTYVGDTVLVLGTTVAFRVVVSAGREGTVLEQPHLVVTSSDTGKVDVTSGQDSLRAKAIGPAALTITFQSSMLTDSARTTTQAIRVKP